MNGFFPTFLNVVIPLLAGLLFFAMAKYVKQIAPLRTLVTGALTYKGAFVGFLFFGIYLASRPLQILIGPHPWPLIINNMREFCMIGIFGPAVFVAITSLVFGAENVPRKLVIIMFSLGCILGVVFMVANVFGIGGSELIFKIGKIGAYDGLWFKNHNPNASLFMTILFIVRLIDPVFLLIISGLLAFWHAFTYPPEKRQLYDNMPKKLILLGLACCSFALSMLSVGLLYVLAHVPNQWWIYYLGAFIAGLLEMVSLSLPVRKAVTISEHL